MKKIIVVVRNIVGVESSINECGELEFKAKRDYLTVHNNEEGLLIINDVSHNRDTDNRILDQLAVFNRNVWMYWRELEES